VRNAEVAHGRGDEILVELSRRNLEMLLAKLDDPASVRTIHQVSEDGQIHVFVRAVENQEHYENRDPGPMYMPSTGEVV
jgi:hypothetical protein